MTHELAITFLRPTILVLLILVPLIWFLPRRFPSFVHGLIRSLAIAALVLALAEPTLVRPNENETIQIAVVDRSESVAGATDLSPDTLFGPAERSTRRTLIHVGPTKLGTSEVGEGTKTTVVDASEASARGRDPVTMGLDEALRRIPEGVRASLTLATDGAGSNPQWRESFQRLASRGIPVFTKPLARKGPDAYPRRVELTESAAAGQTSRVAVDLVGHVQDGELVLFADDVEVARTRVTCAGAARVHLEFEPDVPGWTTLRAELRSDARADVVRENNSLTTLVAVDDPIRILYAGNRMAGARTTLQRALGRGFSFVAASPDGGDWSEALSATELLWLDDIPANRISARAQELLSQAVREQGLGLLYSGGQQAFGPGGYVDTPIAKLLPVEPNQKEEKRDPSTTLVVIIDTSGSMGGERVQLAKEVARLAMRRLLPHDKVGIVEFYGAKRWAAPIQPASNAIELQRALNRLDAGGGTVIMPAIEEAYYGLRNVQTRYKHVLVLTDGGVESGAFEPLIRKMAEKGITTSTVLVGPDAHSEFLVNIATWGRGRYYSVPNRFNLPEILLKQPTNARLPSYRQGTVAVAAAGGRSWFGERVPDTLPPLEGYAECNLRDGAELVLQTATRHHPILASWMMEAGRVTALATEPTGPGMTAWRELDTYGNWIARWVRRTARGNHGLFAYTTERSGGANTVMARALVPTQERPAAHIVNEHGKPSSALEFHAVGHGVYRTVLPSTAEPLRIVTLDPSGRSHRLVAHPFPNHSPELQEDPHLRMPLAKIASATGGHELIGSDDRPVQASRVRGEVPKHFVPLWPWCFMLALIAYLADVAWRRRP